MAIRWHEDAPHDLRAAIQFTGQETGFLARLIEKDYFCSVVLDALADAGVPLVFKGGTCLAKVHSGFFRLSEDLDFTMSTAPDSTRTERRRAIAPIKGAIAELPDRTHAFDLLVPLQGHNNSTQYNATLAYRSCLSQQVETIHVEIGLREPLLSPPEDRPVRTSLLHWVTGEPLLDTFPVSCLSYPEAMAEKLRAALCRRDIAIRDFFDIDHAMITGRLNPMDPAVLELLRRKLAVPGTGQVDASAERLSLLRHELDARLRPVLREREYARFDLARAVEAVRAVALEIGGRR